MPDRTLRVVLSSDVTAYEQGLRRATSATRDLASQAKGTSGTINAEFAGAGRSADSLAGHQKAVAQASEQVRRTRRNEEVAAGNVRVAELRLSEVRDKSGAKASQIERAENQVRAARAKLEDQTDRTAAAEAGLRRETERQSGAWHDLSRSLVDQRQSWDAAAGSLLKLGAAAAGGVALVTKAAMGWESSWTGVTKTVDGTTDQLAGLEDELRAMARTMPQSHADIAAVAEAAGQLGVATEDVAEFSKVMLQLGDTTNLTSDEAATSLAQLMNVMSTAGDDVGRLGATVVDLGNNGASTEREIVQMGQRIAAAGNQVGMSETDVLGLANALASVGVNAEAGGTAVSQTIADIGDAVRKGGAELDVLAQTSGVSAAEFRTAWQQDAAGALTMFVEGLGRTQAAGGDAIGVLSDLGITGVRQRDALLRLAGANDLLADSLATADEAWESNSALAIEAAKRYETAESRAKIAWNNIQDSAIEAGQSMLPVVSDMADRVSELARGFGSLPDPVQDFLTKGAAVAGVGALAAGGLIKMVTAGASLLDSLRTLQTQAPKTAGALTNAGKAAGVAFAALAAAKLAGAAIDWLQGTYTPSVVDATTVLLKFADQAEGASASLDEMFQIASKSGRGEFAGFADMYQHMDRWDFKFQDIIRNIAGAESDIDVFNAKMGDLDTALAQMADNGQTEKAGDAFAQLRREFEDQGIAVEELLPLFDDYHSRLKDQANQLGVTDLTAEDYVKWMGGELPDAVLAATTSIQNSTTATDEQKRAAENVVGPISDMGEAAEDAAPDIDDLADSLFDAAGGAIDADKAMLDYRGTLAEAKKAAKENGEATDTNTKKGRENLDTLIGLAEAAQDNIEATFEETAATGDLDRATEQATKKTRDARDQFIKVAEQMGYSREEAKKLADRYGLIPGEVKTNITAPGMEDVQTEVDNLITKVKNADGTTATIKYRVDVGGTTIYERTSSDGSRKATTAAGGGLIRGPGGPTDDLVAAWLSNREFVERAAAVDYYGAPFFQALNEKRIAKEALPAFAAGGPVSQSINVAVPDYSAQLTGYLDRAAARADKLAMDAIEKMFAAAAVWPTNTRNLSGNYAGHSGVDIAAGMGAPILAAATGPITYTGWGRGYGQAIFQDLPSVGHEIVYGHSSRVLTRKGALAEAGEEIGKVGSTGRSTAPHLHVEIAFSPFGSESNREATLAWLGGGASGSDGGAASGAVQQQVRQMMLRFWDASQWSALNSLVQAESSWNPNARNPSSGAYGLFQALPASKIDKYGPRNTVKAQTDFGLNHIRDHYGSPAAAYRAWLGRSPHWYAGGGWVVGDGGPTDDLVPLMGSDGEFVVNARSANMFGPLLTWINAQGLAAGGAVKAAPAPSFGASATFNVAAIVALIRRLESPIKNLTAATQSVKNASAANVAAQRDLRAPREALAATTRQRQTAVDRRDDIRATNAQELKQAKDVVAARKQTYDLATKQLAAAKANTKAERDAVIAARQRDVDTAKRRLDSARDGKASKATISARQKEYDLAKQQLATTRRTTSASKDSAAVKRAQQAVTRADERLDKARARQQKISRDNTNQLAQANKRVTDTTKEKQRAQEEYDKAADRATAKTEALKQAQEELAQIQQQIADQARQVSDAFTDAYLSKSTAVADWVQAMTIGTQDITTLTDRITQLRRLGLSETLISQIMSMAQSQGAPAGTAIADAIISGGSKTITELNNAAQSLQDAADILGYQQATATHRAGGGLVQGSGGPTDDKVRIDASNGEYVQSAAAVDHYGVPFMDAVNERRLQYANATYVRAPDQPYLPGPAPASTQAAGVTRQDLVEAVTAIVDSRPVVANINGDYQQFARTLIGEMDRQRSAKLHRAGIGAFR